MLMSENLSLDDLNEITKSIEESIGKKGVINYSLGKVIELLKNYNSSNDLKDLFKARTYLSKAIDVKQDYYKSLPKLGPAINGVKFLDGTPLYQCFYSCKCGKKSRRYLSEDADRTQCHKCHAELIVFPSTDNDAFDERFNYFIAKNYTD